MRDAVAAAAERKKKRASPVKRERTFFLVIISLALSAERLESSLRAVAAPRKLKILIALLCANERV
jgi:hypothetical protein